MKPILLSYVSVLIGWCGWLYGAWHVAPFVAAYGVYEVACRYDWRLVRILAATACMATSHQCAVGLGPTLLSWYFWLLQWSYMMQALLDASCIVLGPYLDNIVTLLNRRADGEDEVLLRLSSEALEHCAPLRYGPDCSSHDSHSCAVCCDAMRPQELHRHLRCAHVFHAACIDPWLLQRSATCPLCRTKIE
jgi:hypothetical protein